MPTIPLSLDVEIGSSSSATSSVRSSPIAGPSASDDPPTPKQRGRTGILLQDADSPHPRTRSLSLPPSRKDNASILAAESINSSPGVSTYSVNVKFAPLPELPTGRRRKSSAPLGVASRGQLMRRRRGLPPVDATNLNRQVTVNGSTGMWTHEEVEAHLRRQQSSSSTGDISSIKSPADEIEDPFLVFGRKIKGAWKKATAKGKEKGKDKVDSLSTVTPSDDIDQRVVLAMIEPNENEAEEGRVWEEEVGQTFACLQPRDNQNNKPR